jgi:hypothetical protein
LGRWLLASVRHPALAKAGEVTAAAHDVHLGRAAEAVADELREPDRTVLVLVPVEYEGRALD